MTKRQANATVSDKERSYLCVPLKVANGEIAGAFYMDIKCDMVPNSEGFISDFSKFINEKCEEMEITKIIKEFRDEIYDEGPLIQISDPYGS